MSSLEEEKRLFYVATTRAKERLWLLNGHQWYKDHQTEQWLSKNKFIEFVGDSNIKQ